MTVNLTKALRSALQADNLDENLLVESFRRWKDSGDEYGSYLFGKDGAYTTPKIAGQSYRLRHVHLPPLMAAESNHLKFGISNGNEEVEKPVIAF